MLLKANMHLQRKAVKRKIFKGKNIAERWRVERREAGLTPFKIMEEDSWKKLDLWILWDLGFVCCTTLTPHSRE